MQCPRCGEQMRKRKTKEGTFEYHCPVCGLTIGGGRKEEGSILLDDQAPAER